MYKLDRKTTTTTTTTKVGVDKSERQFFNIYLASFQWHLAIFVRPKDNKEQLVTKLQKYLIKTILPCKKSSCCWLKVKIEGKDYLKISHSNKVFNTQWELLNGLTDK